MSNYELTDEEWREFQDMPEQGVSHRAWVNNKIKGRIENLKTENALLIRQITAMITSRELGGIVFTDEDGNITDVTKF